MPGLVLQPQPSGLLSRRREHLLLWHLCEDFFLLSCPALFLASTRDGRGATGRGLLVGVGHPLASAALLAAKLRPGWGCLSIRDNSSAVYSAPISTPHWSLQGLFILLIRR